jgi:hypothetical protein
MARIRVKQVLRSGKPANAPSSGQISFLSQHGSFRSLQNAWKILDRNGRAIYGEDVQSVLQRQQAAEGQRGCTGHLG